jgi:hypothetical protein
MNTLVKVISVRFEVLMVVTLKIIFCDVTTCSLVEVYQCAGGTNDTCPDDRGSMVVGCQYTVTRLHGVTSHKTVICRCQW